MLENSAFLEFSLLEKTMLYSLENTDSESREMLLQGISLTDIVTALLLTVFWEFFRGKIVLKYSIRKYECRVAFIFRKRTVSQLPFRFGI